MSTLILIRSCTLSLPLCYPSFPSLYPLLQITTLLPFDGGVLSAAAGQVRVNNAKLEQIRSFSTEDAFARSVALRGMAEAEALQIFFYENMKHVVKLFSFFFPRG
jgi:hypothetical protein